MNNDFISVNPADLREVATSLYGRRQDLVTLIGQVNGEMQNLRNNGLQQGSAAELLTQRFNALRQEFENKYLPAIHDYITFLRETADAYQNADAQQRQAIEQRFNGQGRTF